MKQNKPKDEPEVTKPPEVPPEAPPTNPLTQKTQFDILSEKLRKETEKKGK